MKQLALVLVGCTALYACSGSREQRAPVNDRMAQRPDLTLPDRTSRTDTSITLSSRTEPSVAVKKPQDPTASPAKKKPARVRHRVRAASPAPKKQLEDSAVRGYAPSSQRDTAPDTAADTTAPRDSASALATVGTAQSTPDTTTAPTDSVISPADSVISPMETS